MRPFVKNRLPQMIALLKKHHITQAYLFGSITTDKFNRKSDVDVLVSIDETLDPIIQGDHLILLWDELEILFGRKVDLLTERSLNNPFFIQSINQNKQLIYES